jgi:mono/diheme cytochrome c family protein
MPSARVENNKKDFTQYKKDVKKGGKPFFPHAMLHDTIMSIVVVAVIIVLTVIWKYSTPGEHTGFDDHGLTEGQSGRLGKLLDDPADAGTINFVPRPDWYFYFLFYLLRIFKWPESVILGTIGIPTIALVLLIALPLIDIRPERHPLKRPVIVIASILAIATMGVLTYKGATAKEALASELLAKVPDWAAKEGYTGNQQAIEGAKLYAQVGCAFCHTYNGAGSSNAGAPDLTDEGAKGKGVQFQIDHLKNPSGVNPGSGMPSFAALGDERLNQLAAFLEASKGGK